MGLLYLYRIREGERRGGGGLFLKFPTYFNRKGKAVPLQTWSGPENSRKLRFPDFMTTAQYGGKVISFTHRPPLPPGNDHYSFLSETESNPEP